MSFATSIVESGVTSGYEVCLELECLLLLESSCTSSPNGKDLRILRSEGGGTRGTSNDC